MDLSGKALINGDQCHHGRAPIIWKPSTGETYIYRQLDTSKQEIRLFQIEVNAMGEVEGHLEHVNLKQFHRHPVSSFGNPSALHYRALSYTWGPPTPCVDITIDGKTFSVRQTLYNFFRLYWWKCQNEYIWIDQICINQADIPERNAQVNMMSNIYKDADVIVWLGEAAPDSGVAFDELETWAERPREELSGSWFNNMKKEAESAIIEVLAREYWSRLWIVQELILARNITFCLGDRKIARRVLGDGIKKIWDSSGLVSRLLQPTSRPIVEFLSKLPDLIRDILLTNDTSDGKHSLPLSKAIMKYAPQKCTDHRDKVYGLQALVLPAQRLVVDYSKPLEAVFEDVMKAAIRHGDVAKNSMYLGKVDDGYYSMPYAVMLARTMLGTSDVSRFQDHLRALEWSHGLLCVVLDLPLMRVCDLWQVWSEMWDNLVQSAIMPRQKQLAGKLLRRSQCYQERLRSDPQWIQCTAYFDEAAGTPFYKQLKDEVRQMVEEAAKDCGFAIVDGFLVHPDDPLWK